MTIDVVAAIVGLAVVVGVIRAGSFGRSDRRDLWDVRVPEHVLVLRLRTGAPYRRIILQVRDPNAAAHDLRRALRASARPTPPHQR